jgi:hypothetical protein
MKATLRKNGATMVTLRVEFHIGLGEATIAVMSFLAHSGDTIDSDLIDFLPKKTIEQAIRNGVRDYGYDLQWRGETIESYWTEGEYEEVFALVRERVQEVTGLT